MPTPLNTSAALMYLGLLKNEVPMPVVCIHGRMPLSVAVLMLMALGLCVDCGVDGGVCYRLRIGL